MGADYVGFINCELQQPLGIEGFLRKLKLRAYRGAIEAQVPPEQRDDVQVQVAGTGTRPQTLSYAGILEQLGTFEKGCASCATCMTGGRKVLGCYQYVAYPVDAKFEELLFAFFEEQLKTRDSIGDQIWRDIGSKQGADTAWHDREGSNLAQRPQPLSNGKMDSGQLLGAFFLATRALSRVPPTTQFAIFVAYQRLVSELVEFARKRAPKGASRTLDQVEALTPLYLGVMVAKTQGGGELYVDS